MLNAIYAVKPTLESIYQLIKTRYIVEINYSNFMTVKSKYRPDIDGLRAVAIIAVVLFHAFPAKFKSAYTGVDIFFVISGFLISSIIFNDLEHKKFSFIDFYSRRIKRIFPALIVVLVSCYGVGWFVLFSDEFAQLGKHIAGGTAFLSNFILWAEAGYFDNTSDSKPLLHLWSLGIEEQFYILWPFILWVSYTRHKSFLGVTILILLASFFYNLTAVFKHLDELAFFSPLSRFWELMAGGILAYLNLHKPNLLNRMPNIKAIIGLTLIILGLLVLRKQTGYPGYRGLLPVVGAFLLISAGPSAWINRYILGSQVMVAIGKISYPLYLWHWVLFSLLWILEGGTLATMTALVAILLSTVLAIGTYLLIERPLHLINVTSTQGKKLNFSLIVVMMFIGGVGVLTYYQNGFEARLANKYAQKYNAVAFLNDQNYPSKTCQELLGIDPIPNERCEANSKNPQYMILGDSHADDVYESISLSGSSLPAIKIAKNNMLPFIDYVSHYARDSADHYGKSILVVNNALVIANKYPSITTVILVTRGEGYFTKENAISKMGSEEKLSSGDSENAFVEGYSDVIRRFQSLGKRVVFVSAWPELEHPPHSFIPRAISIKSGTHDDVMTRESVENKQRNYLRLVTEIKRLNPEITVFDTLPIFCNDSICFAKDDKSLFYTDENHLSLTGSRRLMLSFISWLQDNKKRVPF